MLVRMTPPASAAASASAVTAFIAASSPGPAADAAFVLPHWVSYVQALGPTIVAVAAAFFAGTIGYRQWRTAQNKLKLDLFERRQKIFGSAMWFLDAMLEERIDSDVWESYQETISSAQWLFPQEVIDYLSKLAALSGDISKAHRVQHKAIGTPGEKAASAAVEAVFDEVRRQYQGRLQVFAPYLQMGH
jgi:hypothetical protein